MELSSSELSSAQLIEDTLKTSPAFQKIDNRLFVVKQGSAYVMINIVPLESNRCMVRCAAQLVKDVGMTGDLAIELMKLNSQLRFGAFAFETKGNLVLFIHTILSGETLDAEELIATVSDVALIADEYDDKIIDKYGGYTMRELLEDAALESMLTADPDSFNFAAKA